MIDDSIEKLNIKITEEQLELNSKGKIKAGDNDE